VTQLNKADAAVPLPACVAQQSPYTCCDMHSRRWISLFEMRAFNPATDFPRLAEIFNTIETEPITVELLERNASQYPSDLPRWRGVAVDQAGRVIAYGSCAQSRWHSAGDFWIGATVDPAYYRQRIGTALYEHGLQFATEKGAHRLFCNVRDDFPHARRFAEARDFVVDRHIFDSVLDVTTFDATPFDGIIRSVEASGIRFTTLQALGDTLANRHKVHALLVSTNRDIPGDNVGHPQFEDFQNSLYDQAHALPDGTLIALGGEQWAGFVVLTYDNDELISNYTTGVERAYRGRKIALALKLLSIDYARQIGKKRIMTDNDEANAGMLAINRKLGYCPMPGSYSMLRTL